jgi:hypothetical protein
MLRKALARISHHVWTLFVGCRKGGAEAPPFQTRGQKCGLATRCRKISASGWLGFWQNGNSASR